MPRKPPINWRESDAEKLTKEIERFNAKIYRTRSRHPELADILPETIKKDDKEKMIEEFKKAPRSEFKKELRTLERFSRKGAEHAVTNKEGFTVTNWERREIAIDVAQINRERAIERKKAEEMDVTSRGEKIGRKRAEMGKERLVELQPKKFDFDKIRSRSEWEHLKRTVEKQTRPGYNLEKLERYKMNYIKGMSKVFGEHGEYIMQKIKQLPPELITEVYYREQEATITFMYERQDMDTLLEIIEDIWEKEYEKNPDIASNEFWNAAQETELTEWIERGW